MTVNVLKMLNLLFIVVYLISCILIVYKNIKLAFESCYTLIYVLKYDIDIVFFFINKSFVNLVTRSRKR